MSRRVNRWVEDFIIKPLLFLVGIAVAATFLKAQIGGGGGTFAAILASAGGLTGLGYYFKRKLDED